MKNFGFSILDFRLEATAPFRIQHLSAQPKIENPKSKISNPKSQI